jgi:large subunit ribosomal protein L4e
MTRVPVFGVDGTKLLEVELPPVFRVEVKPKLIERVFWALFTHKLQPKGTDPMAGKRTSAESWGVGYGVARVARVKGSRYPRAGQAAGIAGVVGGRRAHPPRAEKVIHKQVNKKERRLATASAIAATAIRELVESRGHRVHSVPHIPLVVEDKLQEVEKSSQLREILKKLGLWDDVERLRNRNIRCGKSRRRARPKKTGSGPLIVVAEDKGISKAARNFPGLDVVLAKDVSVLHLAPGGKPGRLTVWTVSSLGMLPKPLEEVVIAHGLRESV